MDKEKIRFVRKDNKVIILKDLFKGYLSISIIIILILCSRCTFAEIEIEQRFETGRLNQTDLVEEEDEVLDFSYLKEKTRLSFKDKDKKYSLGYEFYKKDYKARDDRDTNKNTWEFILNRELDKSKDFFFKTMFLQRKYKNLPNLEYESLKLNGGIDLKEKDNYNLDVELRFINYNYLSGEKDYLKYGPKIEFKKYLLDKKFIPYFSYGFYRENKEKASDKTKTIYDLGSILNFKNPFIKSLQFSYKNIQDSAKSEDREDDYSFGLEKFYLKTNHEFRDLDLSLFGEYSKKKYTNYDHDWKGYKLGNSLSYKIREINNKKLQFDLDFNFKNIDYSPLNNLSFKKYSLNPGISYLKRKDYKVFLNLGLDKYDYEEESTNERERYGMKLGLDKYLKENLKFHIHLKNIYTDYKQRPSTQELIFNLGMIYKF